MKAKGKLLDALEIINQDNVSINLYFITRQWKDGVQKSAKIIDKYDFTARAVDLSVDLNDFFRKIAIKQITKTSDNDDYELEEYSVITDDLGDKIYTYALNNALSFSDVINNQLLTGNHGSFSALSEIKNDLWAYCLKFHSNERTLYTFRKASRGKVATDEPRTKLEKLSSYFDTDDAELKVAITETINFDNKVDCLYHNDEFLILRKSGFEQIVGLEEEFIEAASNVIETIKKTGLVEGIELLESTIKEKRSALKTLSNIAKKGTHNSFDGNEIEKMKSVLNEFEGRELNLTPDGKIHLETNDDVTYFVKLLNDFYKQGVVSGSYYGTNSGQIIVPIIN